MISPGHSLKNVEHREAAEYIPPKTCRRGVKASRLDASGVDTHHATLLVVPNALYGAGHEDGVASQSSGEPSKLPVLHSGWRLVPPLMEALTEPPHPGVPSTGRVATVIKIELTATLPRSSRRRASLLVSKGSLSVGVDFMLRGKQVTFPY